MRAFFYFVYLDGGIPLCRGIFIDVSVSSCEQSPKLRMCATQLENGTPLIFLVALILLMILALKFLFSERADYDTKWKHFSIVFQPPHMPLFILGG